MILRKVFHKADVQILRRPLKLRNVGLPVLEMIDAKFTGEFRSRLRQARQYMPSHHQWVHTRNKRVG